MLKSVIIIFLSLAIISCTNTGIPLDPSLTARMDAPNASLNHKKALSIINHYRITKNTSPLSIASDLNQQAQQLASKYAQTGIMPKKPANIEAMQISAGYANFANTFSGWRSDINTANILANPDFTESGIGVAYSANSIHGVYWVLLLN